MLLLCPSFTSPSTMTGVSVPFITEVSRTRRPVASAVRRSRGQGRADRSRVRLVEIGIAGNLTALVVDGRWQLGLEVGDEHLGDGSVVAQLDLEVEHRSEKLGDGDGDGGGLRSSRT